MQLERPGPSTVGCLGAVALVTLGGWLTGAAGISAQILGVLIGVVTAWGVVGVMLAENRRPDLPALLEPSNYEAPPRVAKDTDGGLSLSGGSTPEGAIALHQEDPERGPK